MVLKFITCPFMPVENNERRSPPNRLPASCELLEPATALVGLAKSATTELKCHLFLSAVAVGTVAKTATALNSCCRWENGWQQKSCQNCRIEQLYLTIVGMILTNANVPANSIYIAYC